MKNELTMNDFLPYLDAIWLLMFDDIDSGYKGSPDADMNGRRFGVSRRNVIELIKHNITENTRPHELFEIEGFNEVEIEERYYDCSSERAQKQAEYESSKEKHITLEHFVKSFIPYIDDFHRDTSNYSLYGESVCSALNVDTDDLNPEYWEQAKEDGLLPAQAAFDLLRIPD